MRNRTHWTLSLAIIATMALVPAGAALGQAEQPPAQQEEGQRQQQQGRQGEDPQQQDRQAEDQQQAEGQQQDAVTGISMEGTLRAVDAEQRTLLVAVDPASIMASEGESLANVPELNRGAEARDAEAGRDQQQAGQEAQAQTAEAEASAPLLLFHYDDQTEVVGDTQRIEGLSEQPNAYVRIDYRAEGNRAIAERIEVRGDPQEAQPEGREAEEQDNEPGNPLDF